MSDKKEKNSLTSLRTVEVSLVPKGAVRKRFAIFKGDENMFDEILKAVLETKIEGEEKMDEIVKKANLSEKAIAAVKGALRLLSGFKEEIPQDIFSKLSEVAGYGYPMPENKKEAGCGLPGEKEKGMEPTKKNLDGLPAELKETVEKMFKEHEEAQKRNEVLQKSLDEERDARINKELTEQAKAEFGAMPAKPEEIAAVLKAVPEEIKKNLSAMFKAANDLIAKSKLLEEVGKSSTNDSSGSAWAKIEAAASAIVQKGANKLSHAQAVDAVLRTPEGQALYQEFLTEKK